MKIFKIVILSIICFLLNLKIVSADGFDYKKIYMNYIENINDKEAKVLFYDIDKNNIPEMILYKYIRIKDNEFINKEVFNNIHEIYTINNGNIEKLFNIENETEIQRREPISFFITKGNKLYYAMQDRNLNGNIQYYKLNYVNGKITSDFVGRVESNVFGGNIFANNTHWNNGKLVYDGYEKLVSGFNEKFYVKETEVSEEEFVKEINFKQTIPFIYTSYTKEIEFALNNVYNIPANPTIVFNIRSVQLVPTTNTVGIERITYNNGMYDYFELGTTKEILMINGNIVPKMNIIKEDDKIFLPLRNICDYVNKQVLYDNLNNVIKIDNTSIDLNKKKVINTDEIIDIKNVDGVSYFPLDFFNKYLNFNVDKLMLYTKNIISLENIFKDTETTFVSEARDNIINNVKETNKESIEEGNYKLKDVVYKQNLGIYYVFDVNYTMIFKDDIILTEDDRILTLLYDKYTNKIYEFYNGIQEIYNNEIDFH